MNRTTVLASLTCAFFFCLINASVTRAESGETPGNAAQDLSGSRGAAVAPAQAKVRALNSITATKELVLISHPKHQGMFSKKGFKFTPRNSGPECRWQLSSITGADRASWVL